MHEIWLTPPNGEFTKQETAEQSLPNGQKNQNQNKTKQQQQNRKTKC